MVQGSWNPVNADYDSRATWAISERDSSIRLRIPWAMLGIADPSAHLALGMTDRPRYVPFDSMGVRVWGSGSSVRIAYRWPQWETLPESTRLVAGVEELASAYEALGQ